MIDSSVMRNFISEKFKNSPDPWITKGKTILAYSSR